MPLTFVFQKNRPDSSSYQRASFNRSSVNISHLHKSARLFGKNHLDALQVLNRELPSFVIRLDSLNLFQPDALNQADSQRSYISAQIAIALHTSCCSVMKMKAE